MQMFDEIIIVKLLDLQAMCLEWELEWILFQCVLLLSIKKLKKNIKTFTKYFVTFRYSD